MVIPPYMYNSICLIDLANTVLPRSTSSGRLETQHTEQNSIQICKKKIIYCNIIVLFKS